MSTAGPQGILACIKSAENLKNTLRASFTSNGRPESAAEHSWRLCLLVMACAPLYPALRVEKLLKLAVLHDLGEAVCGDVPATRQSPPWQVRQPSSVDTGTVTLVVAITWSRSSRASTVTTG